MQVSLLRWGDRTGLRRQGYLAALSLCGTCWAPSPFSLPRPVLRPQEPRASFGTGGVWAEVAGGGL